LKSSVNAFQKEIVMNGVSGLPFCRFAALGK
jgi:hypothetical protein